MFDANKLNRYINSLILVKGVPITSRGALSSLSSKPVLLFVRVVLGDFGANTAMEFPGLAQQFESIGFKPNSSISGILVASHKNDNRRHLSYQEDNATLALHCEIQMDGFWREIFQDAELDQRKIEVVLTAVSDRVLCMSVRTRMNTAGDMLPLYPILEGLVDSLAKSQIQNK